MDLNEEQQAEYWKKLMEPAIQYAEKGNHRKAIKLLEKIASDNLDNQDLYYVIQIQIAVLLGNAKKDNEAISKFKSIPKYGNEKIYLEAQRWLGDFFISRKKWKELEELYAELRVRELEPSLRVILAGFLCELKRYNEAIMLLEPITRDDGDYYACAKSNQIVVSMKNKDYNKVIQLSKMLLPEDGLELYYKSRLNLADALIKLNRKSEAFNTLIKIETNGKEYRAYSEAQWMLWINFPIKTLCYKLKIR